MDHKPLTATLPSSAERFPKQFHYLSFIAEFTSDIQFICGKHIVVAGVLSRVNCTSMMPIIDNQQLAADHASSAELYTHQTAFTRLVFFLDVHYQDDLYLEKPRPVIPSEWTYRISDAMHSLTHPGSRPIQRVVSVRFV